MVRRTASLNAISEASPVRQEEVIRMAAVTENPEEESLSDK